jgi:hypothetical protein
MDVVHLFGLDFGMNIDKYLKEEVKKVVELTDNY